MPDLFYRSIMNNTRKITYFFSKRKDDNETTQQESKRFKASTSAPEQEQTQPDPNPNVHEILKPNTEDFDITCMERDPGKRKQMWEYLTNVREEIRLRYLNLGPFQVHLKKYPSKKKQDRRFRFGWFRLFPNWLEYSPSKDSAYCFLCFLFSDKPNVRSSYDAFTITGFDNWKKVNAGKNCAFLKHVGSVQHRNAVTSTENLLNQKGHIENIIEKQSDENTLKNRMRLKASIDVVRWLTFQACAFRGNDETTKSKNRGNFIEMLKLLASYNDELAKVVLDNAPYNSKFTSGLIQKEILGIIANNVRKHIRSEVGDSYFCVMVDEARDESKKEQMAIVLRFVDKDGVLRERFLNVVHVNDTCSLTLKTNLWNQLLHYQFDTNKIRGQSYDGASNMRGEWNGLQALVANDCPYAYYVHCFAHRLQLALVASSREVIPIHQFFTKLTFIINVVCASSKRHDELQKSKADEIKRLLELGETKTGKGKNQVGTIRRASDTRWGSHFNSVCSLIDMYDATFVVLRSIVKDGCLSQRGDADAAYVYMKSFEFVIILHLIKEIMGMTNTLSQALQNKTQDIGNAIDLVSATKESLNNFRNSGWNNFLEQAIIFSKKHQVDIPDFKAPYKSTRYRPRGQDNQVSVEHYYRVDIFICTLDKQLHEMESRFNDHAMELLTLTSYLVPKRIVKVCDTDQICHRVKKYYPADFTEQERIRLRYELEIFKIELSKNSKLCGVATISELCKALVKTEKCEAYPMIDRLIRLILTLPVSTATTERAFSAMKLCKNRLRNKMSDDFLADNLVVNIEKDIAERFDSEAIINEFKDVKGRRAEL
ncbi:uncharacterized protein [Rutidosis leptorrhynchoides]|uniref:uncharacterized protein n=1 Tax=Rutidosis leptorrhynchoides TaxID=125765 RepID=UPI003A9A63DB